MKAVTRERNPRGQGERLRVDLIDAAVDLIAETGSVDGVSLRAAAKRAGVSPMAVYNHFADKDALLVAAVEHCWDEFQAAIAVTLDEPEPSARLRAAGDAYVRFALEHPGRYAVMFSGTRNLPERAVPIGMSAFDTLVAMVADILDARHDGRDPAFVAVQVHTWIHGMVSLLGCAPDGPWPSTDTLLDDLMVRLGLGPPTA
ncbi:MAG TPA: TetR/AcrR family transcriptional regulator [Acidimicrobiales bacterium]|nr:TetR/AcrR family transcriptional regulator [Acidimicrobiales bacterium]